MLVAAARALLLSATITVAGAAQAPPYRDATLPLERRVGDLLARATLEEKFWQLFMIPGDLDSAYDYSHGVFGLQVTPRSLAARADAERINAVQRYFVEQTRLGIPIIPFEEAVHGLGREGSTMFPSAIALAASWDTTLMRDVATAIAEETRTRGIRQVLSPVVNIANDVRWGRVEETYGEDPYLASRMAVAYVAAMERAGVVATPKHFVANVGAGGRDSYPIDVDERLLEELFYPPFHASIDEGHAHSIMSAYNSVDGVPATQNRRLLTDKLRGDWKFPGFVISDQAATGGATVLHDTERSTAGATADALNAGLDVIFQSAYPQHRPYLDAFRRGLISNAVIDSALARVLRVKFALGLFEHPYARADSAEAVNHSPQHVALARRAAQESIVLLRNEHGTLPLPNTIASVAVIGRDAAEARLGGYSGPPRASVSIVDALRERLGPRRIVYAPGVERMPREYVVVPAENLSVRGEYFDNNRLERMPRVTRTDPRIDFGWTLNAPARGIPFDWYSVRWTGTITAPASGVRQLGVEGNDGYRLYVDDRLIVDDWRKQSYAHHLAAVNFAPGSRHAIRLEYFESTGNARVKLVWDAGVRNDSRAEIDSAVAIARRSSLAVVVAGIEEGEFRDRALLGLPGKQDELIERVAATGTPTVVLLVGGSAITMSRWLENVGAVVDVWYPGEQGGRAVADVLFGDVDPAGRLPVTFPVFEGQLPLVYNHRPTGRGDDYVDLTGQPLFPFGFGLSYTSFEYSNLTIEPATILANGAATIRGRVKNTGERDGDEVVQLYLRDLLATTVRPVMQLEGFARVHLAPGEERTVSFRLSSAELRMLDRDMHWVVEPGTFRVMIGASSKDIRLRGELVVQ